MKILLTYESTPETGLFMPAGAIAALRRLGRLEVNELGRPFTREELLERVGDADICVTHWGCPMFDGEIVGRARRLKLIAHAAGSVAYIVSDAVYEKGIRVCSANTLMAQYVAEGTLAYMLAALRMIPQHDAGMKNRSLWDRRVAQCGTLIGARVSLVGLGTVGRFLLRMLEPFHVEIRVFDPYLDPGALACYPGARLCSLEEALSWGDIVSVHASLTPETYHLLGRRELSQIRDGALLVNTARGNIIDQEALLDELKSGRIQAILDVFDQEPLPADSLLRALQNVILQPHMAGVGAKEQMAYCMVDEVERYINGVPLQNEITYAQYRLMTRTV